MHEQEREEAAYGQVSSELGKTEENTDITLLVPARIVNEYSYCPRLAFMEWVQNEFAVNAEVAEGRFNHRVVDQETGSLPNEVAPDEAIHARSVWLSAYSERLTAKIDLIESDGGFVFPVDYKRSDVPDNDDRSWEADRVQLCANGLVLRENGYSCDGGVLYYVGSKMRIEIPFDDELIRRTREIVTELLELNGTQALPPPLQGSPKCFRCSLNGICLPDEVNLLARGAFVKKSQVEEVRRLAPARDDALPLYVQEQGARISKKGGELEVYVKGSKAGAVNLFETSQVSLFGNIQISTQAMQELMTSSIPLSFFSTGGWFYGMAAGFASKNVYLRQKQYQASNDKVLCLRLAKEMVAAKIDNCRTLLMRNHEASLQDIPKRLKTMANRARSAESLSSLLGYEGIAARIYFGAFQGMIKKNSDGPGWTFNLETRNRRPPSDPINALLSYGYSLLAKDFTVVCQSVGFDPFMGFYHQIHYGRPSLALDFMEEFRPIVADSVVLWVINNGVISPEDFICRGKAFALKPQARKKFIGAYERRLDTLVTHPVFGYQVSYRRVFEIQVRLASRVLMGEIEGYPAFRTR